MVMIGILTAIVTSLAGWLGLGRRRLMLGTLVNIIRLRMACYDRLLLVSIAIHIKFCWGSYYWYLTIG